MARLSVTEAAQRAQVSRTTINRHIASGKLSADVDEKGRKWIDSSELDRVYHGAEQSSEHVSEQVNTSEIVELLKKQVADLQHQLENAEYRENSLLQIITEHTRLLASGQAVNTTPPQKRRGFIHWLLRRV